MDTRQKLLSTATETVRKGGSSSLNFRDLGSAVGMKSSTVHYHFPTKANLLEEMARQYRAQFLAALNSQTEKSRSIGESLTVLVDMFADAQASKVSCLCGMLATECEYLDPKVTSAVNEFFKSLNLWVVQQLKLHAVKRPAGLAPPKFAELVIALLEGSILLGRLESHESTLDSAREWIRQVD